jgi:hypothetical protein
MPDLRDISTEGLVFEHYILTLRRIEMAYGPNAFSERLSIMLRQSEIADELNRREIQRRRAM